MSSVNYIITLEERTVSTVGPIFISADIILCVLKVKTLSHSALPTDVNELMLKINSVLKNSVRFGSSSCCNMFCAIVMLTCILNDLGFGAMKVVCSSWWVLPLGLR